MNGYQAIATILQREGVEQIFGFPYNPIFETSAALGIRPVISRIERTAVNMADGLSRVTNGRRIGVVAVQDGPGIENAFAGVAQAFGDNVPILVLPLGPLRRRQRVAPNFDPVVGYATVTKWADSVNFADRIPEMLRRAFTYLRMGRPGPVLVEVPRDVGEEAIDESLVAAYKPVRGTRPAADPADVERVARTLLTARFPIIQAGQGVLWAEAWDELRELAELVQAPVLTTVEGKGVFPEDHPLALGAAGISGPKAIAHCFERCDVIFGIGTSFTRALVSAPLPSGKTLIQATVDERDLNKAYQLDQALIGDAKLVLRQLIAAVRDLRPSGRDAGEEVRREVAEVKQAWLAEWMPRLTSDDVPLSPYRVIWDLMHTVDRRRTIVTHDSGNPRDQMVPFWETLVPRGYLGWGKSTQLGYSLGLAMGAKLGAPDKLVVNVMGDAAIGMAGMDLETAARTRTPILTVVLNNAAMGGYEKYYPLATEKYGIKYLSGGYARLAEALGVVGLRVERPEEIVPTLRRAIGAVEEGRPALVEFVTREEPVFSLHWPRA